MQTAGAHRTAVLLALLIGTVLLLVLAPTAAHAAWLKSDARIIDPYGTGYVGLLNVRVVGEAVSDTTAVTGMQFSDDGVYWDAVPYTGAPQPWVLYGESGAKTLYVRFAGADGTLSPVTETHIAVDTVPPRTAALGNVRAAAGGAASFAYTITDPASPQARAELVISGRGGRSVKTVRLGWVATGEKLSVPVVLRLPKGSYRWSVRAIDLAHWVQEKQVAATLTVN